MDRRFVYVDFSIFAITSTSTPVFEKLGFVSMTMLGFLLGLSMAWEPSIEIEKRGIAIQLLGENRQVCDVSPSKVDWETTNDGFHLSV